MRLLQTAEQKRDMEAAQMDRSFASAEGEMVAAANAESVSRDKAWATASGTMREEVAAREWFEGRCGSVSSVLAGCFVH